MSNINHEYRHVFIHVPKVAGTSMSRLPWVGGLGHQRAVDLVPKAPADYVTWGFVRNPYDRLVSVYHAASQHPRNWPTIEEAGSFAEFIRRLSDKWQVEPHAYPQTEFLCDADGNLMVEFVGRFERLAEDFAEVCRRVGVESELPHHNATDRGPWEDYYTPELIAVVNTVYDRDFRTFGYEKIQ